MNAKKTTSEKPISLSPLNFKEALSALLKVKLKTDNQEVLNTTKEKKKDKS